MSTTANPIAAAFAAPPHWMPSIRDFDGLELWPCRVAKVTADGREVIETCEPELAEFWSVYGHCREGGVDCLEDFDTHTAALAFAQRLLAAYPHLNTLGLSDNG